MSLTRAQKQNSINSRDDLVAYSSREGRAIRERFLEPKPDQKISLPQYKRSPGFDHRVSEYGIGSYYWKEDTRQKDLNLNRKDCGIRQEVTLPRFAIDRQRYHYATNGEAWTKTGPMDRASLYIGVQAFDAKGISLGKSDCGVAWQRVIDAKGSPTFTDRSDGTDMRDPKHRFTILAPNRPITLSVNGSQVTVAKEVKDGNGTLRFSFGRDQSGKEFVMDSNNRIVCSGPNAFKNFQSTTVQPNFAFIPFARIGSDWARLGDRSKQGNLHMAFYPGEKIVMRLVATDENQLRFDVRKPGSRNHIVGRFAQEGVGVGNAQVWKNVVAIDQFSEDRNGKRCSNEGKRVIPTASRLEEAQVHQTTIFHGGSTMRSPGIIQALHDSGQVTVGKDINSRKNKIFEILSSRPGMKKISVHPMA